MTNTISGFWNNLNKDKWITKILIKTFNEYILLLSCEN